MNRFLFSLFIIFVNYLVVEAVPTVAEAFIASNIVPDVLNEAPTRYCDVMFDSGLNASLGNELTPTQVKDQPSISFNGNPDAFYTLILVDPDYDNVSDQLAWQHWLVGNIPGSDVSQGEVLSEYIGAGPGIGSGLHRYVFIVYKQPSKLVFDETRLRDNSTAGREGFSTIEFAEKYNLGTPLAGNFYVAQYDDYVPILYEKIGLSA